MYVSASRATAVRVGPLALSLLAICGAQVVFSQNNLAQSSSRDERPLPEYVEEFFLSDAVRNQDKGEVQFTLGVESRQEVGTNAVAKVEYGVTKRLQLGFDLPYGMTEGESPEGPARWSTASLGLQYQIVRSDSPLALSFGMVFGVPVKSVGEVEYQPTVLAAKTFRKLQVHASFVADIEEWKPSFQYNLASVYPIQRRWFPTLEFNGRRLRGKDSFYLTPGLYRRFENRFEFGVGVPWASAVLRAPRELSARSVGKLAANTNLSENGLCVNGTNPVVPTVPNNIRLHPRNSRSLGLVSVVSPRRRMGQTLNGYGVVGVLVADSKLQPIWAWKCGCSIRVR